MHRKSNPEWSCSNPSMKAWKTCPPGRQGTSWISPSSWIQICICILHFHFLILMLAMDHSLEGKVLDGGQMNGEKSVIFLVILLFSPIVKNYLWYLYFLSSFPNYFPHPCNAVIPILPLVKKYAICHSCFPIQHENETFSVNNIFGSLSELEQAYPFCEQQLPWARSASCSSCS